MGQGNLSNVLRWLVLLVFISYSGVSSWFFKNRGYYSLYDSVTDDIVSSTTDITVGPNTHMCTAGDTQCSSNCGDLCSCKKLECEYQFFSENCYPEYQEKWHEVDDFTDDKFCFRPNVYYSFAGELRKNSRARGRCNIESVVVAVNIYGDELVSSRGIPYVAHEDYLPSVNADQAQEWVLDDYWEGDVYGALDRDQGLFWNMMQSIDQSQSCTEYLIPTMVEGYYELSILTMDGEYNQFGQRLFSIYLNDLRVFPEIDVTSLADTRDCMAPFTVVELGLPFQIIVITDPNGGLQPLGFAGSNVSAGIQQPITLKFCPSECPPENFDNSFIVAAFAVVKMSEDDEAQKEDCDCFHNDICECKINGCEYNADNTECSPGYQDCVDFSSLESEYYSCARAGVFYTNGGVVCRYVGLNATCAINSTIYALNIVKHSDHAKTTFTDSRGIEFADGFRQKPAYGDSRIHFNEMDTDKVFGVFEEDKPLFKYMVYGNYPIGSEQCLAYSVYLYDDDYYTDENDPNYDKMNGKYELTIRALDGYYHEPGKRLFNIKFAGLDVFPEVDIIRLANVSPRDAQYAAVELGVMFKLEAEKTADGGRVVILTVDGFDPVETDAAVYVEFCYSQCARSLDIDPGYVAASIAVVKFGDTIPEPPCIEHGADLCECKKHGCEINTVIGVCENGAGEVEAGQTFLVCLNDNSTDGIHAECYQDDVWYSEGGVLCQFEQEMPDYETFCPDPGDSAYAKNLCGDTYTGDKGIVYEGSLLPDFGADLVECFDNKLAANLDPTKDPDPELYKTIMFGKDHDRMDGACFGYNIPLAAEGNYEISIKTMDAYFSKPGIRYFSIRFAGWLVFPEIDLIKLAGPIDRPIWSSYIPVVLAVAFKVWEDGVNLTVKGFPMIEIQDGSVPLEFCYSNCTQVVNPVPAVSAFAVYKVKDFPCTWWNNSVCKCKEAGCDYDAGTGTCMEPILDNEIYRDCYTLPETEYYIDMSVCKRDSVWYSYGSVMCQVERDANPCSLAAAYGVNLGGPKVVGHRSIVYQEGHLIPPVSGEEFARFDAPRDIIGTQSRDDVLFQSILSGITDLDPIPNGTCMTYEVPLKQNGFYELSIKTVEMFYNQPAQRWFTVMFAGVPVFLEIDIFKMANATSLIRGKGENPNLLALELASHFMLSEDRTLLQAHGFPAVPIVDLHTTLQFCFSDCADPETQNASFVAAAFSVALLDDCGHMRDGCKAHNGKPCDCKSSEQYGGCEYRIPEKRCERYNTGACDRCFNPEHSYPMVGPQCRTPDSFYASGAVLCKAHQRDDIVKCNVVETMYAINFGGPAHTDTRGIVYVDGKTTVTPEDLGATNPLLYDLDGDPKNRCGSKFSGFPPEDLMLYRTGVRARSKKPKGCIKYPYGGTALVDGQYELGIKFLEYYWDLEGARELRQFSVKLGTVDILFEFSISKRYVPKECVGMEVIAPFEVSNGGTLLTVLGHPPVTLDGTALDLLICQSMGCQRVNSNGENVDENDQLLKTDPKYQASAFYIARVEDVASVAMDTYF